jgi:hypothetical protein
LLNRTKTLEKAFKDSKEDLEELKEEVCRKDSQYKDALFALHELLNGAGHASCIRQGSCRIRSINMQGIVLKPGSGTLRRKCSWKERDAQRTLSKVEGAKRMLPCQ